MTEQRESRPSSRRRKSEVHIEKSLSQPHLGLQLWDGLSKQTHDAFVSNIPSEYIKLLEPKKVTVYAAFLYALLLAVACSIFASTYISTQAAVYLSPLRHSNCVPIDKPATGKYLGDLNGQWSGTRGFDPTIAPFQFEMNNFTTEVQQLPLPTGSTGEEAARTQTQTELSYFKEIMFAVKSVLGGTVRADMMSKNTAGALLYMMMWSLQTSSGGSSIRDQTTANLQTFSFTGSPGSTFGNIHYHAGGLGTGSGFCGVQPSVTFEAATFLWTVSFDLQKFYNDNHCTNALPTAKMGTVKGESTLELKIDARSFFSAVAANQPRQQVNPFRYENYERKIALEGYRSYLKAVKWADPTEHILRLGASGSQRPYSVSQFFDTRYPGMDAIFCVSPVADNAKTGDSNPADILFCLVKMGYAFVYPLFDSFGTDAIQTDPREPGWTSAPSPCRCDFLNGGPAANLSPEQIANCRHFDFLSSIIIFPSDLFNPSQPAMTEFLTQAVSQHSPVSELGYNASFFNVPRLVRSNGSSNSTFDYQPPNPTAAERLEAFRFCSTNAGNCSMLTIRSFNPSFLFSAMDFKVSSGYYSMSNGFCNFSLLTPSWQKLVDVPPVSLEQEYYKCYPLAFPNVLITSLGLSAANTSAIAPLIVLLFVNAIFFWQWFTGHSPPRAYSQREKDQVLGLLAKRVLLLMGEKRESQSDRIPEPYSSQPILEALIKELGLGTENQPSEIFVVREPDESAPGKRLAAAVFGCCSSNNPKATQKIDQEASATELPRLRVSPLALSVDKDSPSSKEINM